MKALLSLSLFVFGMLLPGVGRESAIAEGTPHKASETSVASAYQWTEDPKTIDTGTWIAHRVIDAQANNQPEIAERLTALLRTAKLSISCAEDGVYFFCKRGAEENVGSIYRRMGLQGRDEKLIDATKVGAKRNLIIFDTADDSSLLVYGVPDRRRGEQVVRVFDVKSGQDLPELLPRARYNTVSLSPGNKGLYYTKIESTGTRVYLHSFGGETSADKLIFGDTYNYEPLGPNDLISTRVTENGEILIFSVARGEPASKRVDAYTQELREPDQRVRPIIHGMNGRFSLTNHDDELFALTNYEAPKNRVVKILIDDPSPLQWKSIVSESADLVFDITVVGERLFVSSQHGAVMRTRIFSLEGAETGEVLLPMTDAINQLEAFAGSSKVHHRCSRR